MLSPSRYSHSSQTRRKHRPRMSSLCRGTLGSVVNCSSTTQWRSKKPTRLTSGAMVTVFAAKEGNFGYHPERTCAELHLIGEGGFCKRSSWPALLLSKALAGASPPEWQ